MTTRNRAGSILVFTSRFGILRMYVYTFIYLVDSVDKGREFVLKYVRVFMYVFIQVCRLDKFFYVWCAL